MKPNPKDAACERLAGEFDVYLEDERRAKVTGGCILLVGSALSIASMLVVLGVILALIFTPLS